MRSGIALDALDLGVRPQDDLFGFANGRWIAETEIPEDRARFGTFHLLADAAELHLREILEADTGKPGDLYASFMDQQRVDELGVSPLDEPLAAISAVADTEGLLRLLGAFQRGGVGGAFAPYVNTDARDSERYVVYLQQAGLGLPDESYYREDTTPRSGRPTWHTSRRCSRSCMRPTRRPPLRG
jgi:predicted metalloendopeptidase